MISTSDILMTFVELHTDDSNSLQLQPPAAIFVMAAIFVCLTHVRTDISKLSLGPDDFFLS